MESHKPQDESQLAEILSEASAKGTPLELEGLGSKRGFGRPFQADGTLSLAAFSGVSLYEPEELVLTAGAATPLAEIEPLLEEAGQMLAFEPADYGPLLSGQASDRRLDSLGGLIACNLSGPRRPKAGAARDHVLGLRGVTGQGACFKTGGRVVKNVTGYDLCKLLTGSFGTLAAMTEITVKVLPRPEKTRSLLFSGLSAETANQLFNRALGSAYDVSGAAHLPAPLAAASNIDLVSGLGEAVTALRLEGPEPSVMARQAGLTALLAALAAPVEELHATRSLAFWKALRDAQPFVSRAKTAIWRLSLPPASGAAAVAALDLDDSDYWLDWGGGLLWLACPESAPQPPALAATLQALGGHATLVRANEGLRAALPVFMPQAEGVAALAGRIKASLDPKAVLNPGRLYAGL
ncbi:MAG: glycolate oxidase subunit GlcE [Pseudomonadota bacterium]